MIEASANNAAMSPDFSKQSGWGFLQADKMFTMLDPTIGTYRLFHYTITGSNLNTSTATYTSTWQKITLQDVGSTGSLASGSYSYKVREIKGSIQYASSIDRDPAIGHEVYTWGTAGADTSATHFGWMPGSAIIEEPWADVIDAEGGDGTYPNIQRPGIRHSFSDIVHAHTYQYEISTDGGSTFQTFPPDANLGINITVFGSSTVPASVAEKPMDEGGLSVWPSISSEKISVHSTSSERATFEVFDAVGREVIERDLNTGHSDFQIATALLPEGIYTCRLISQSVSQVAKFLVRH